MVPYLLVLYASNSAGTGAEFARIIFTLEGSKCHALTCTLHVPTHLHLPLSLVPPPPNDVQVDRISDTAILVSWTPINILEARGHISNYTIYYTAQLNRMRQARDSVTVPATNSNATITGLDPALDYRVTVSASTDVGRSNESTEVVAMTLVTDCMCVLVFIF